MQDTIEFNAPPGFEAMTRQSWVVALLAGLLSALLFAPAYETFVEADKKDFAVVSREADQIRQGEPLRATHFLAPTAVAMLLEWTPVAEPLRATWWFMVLCQAATASLLFALLAPLLPAHGWASRLFALAASLALQWVAPIALLSLPDKALYAGYFNSHNFHNPSSHLLEPMALVLFFASAQLWPRRTSFATGSIVVIVGLAVLHVAALVTKPSFSLVFVPAVLGLGLLAAFRRWSPVNWFLVLGAVALPFFAVSSWQFRGTFSSEAFAAQPRGLAVRPFQIYLDMVDPVMIPVNIVASVAFPLAVLGLALRRRSVNAELLLAWIAYFGAAILALFVIDGVVEIVDGERTLQRWRAGNFWWSVQVAGFLLFVASLRSLVAHRESLSPAARWTCGALLLAHASFGGLRWALHATGAIWNGWT